VFVRESVCVSESGRGVCLRLSLLFVDRSLLCVDRPLLCVDMSLLCDYRSMTYNRSQLQHCSVAYVRERVCAFKKVSVVCVCV